MPSIFPGMDPYLEAPWIWPDFHNSFADEIRRILNELLPKHYFAQLEARSELGIRAAKRINRTYDGGPYQRGAVDYSKPPIPPLAASLEQWRNSLQPHVD